jgi:hypothetical protein
MVSRIFILMSIVVGFSSLGQAQQAACTTLEVPVGVINVSGNVFRGLAAEDFIGRVQKKAVGCQSHYV